MLSEEYGWLPNESDNIDWYNILRYSKALKNRKKNEIDQKIQDYIMLLMIIHIDNPNKLLSDLQNIYEPKNEIDDEIGDIKALKRLKSKKGGC